MPLFGAIYYINSFQTWPPSQFFSWSTELCIQVTSLFLVQLARAYIGSESLDRLCQNVLWSFGQITTLGIKGKIKDSWFVINDSWKIGQYQVQTATYHVQITIFHSWWMINRYFCVFWPILQWSKGRDLSNFCLFSGQLLEN